MPPSQVQIVNIALAHLGQGPINDMADGSANGAEASRLVRLRWTELVEALLSEFPWGFAKTRASATAQATAPVWKWANAFPLDPNYLRVLEVEGDDTEDWAIEMVGGVTCIVTNLDSPLHYAFISRDVTVDRYSPLFVQVLSSRIALELAEPITRDQSIIKNMAELYNSKLKLARQAHSQERTPVQIDATTWTDARSQGSSVLARLDGDPDPLVWP